MYLTNTFVISKTLQKIILFFWSVFSCFLLNSCKIDSKSNEIATSKFDASTDNHSSLNKNISESTLSENVWTYYLPKPTKNQIVKHDYYILSYNEQAEQADWVAYELKKKYLKSNGFHRPYFIEDPMVSTHSADWRNYKKSGYDKGHLCPAADMKFDLKAYNDTFYTSNISPQTHDFNAGIWNRLEEKVRYWANSYDNVIVITGGILNNNKETIGNEKVVVPNFFYKIIFKKDKNGQPKTIAFLMPNEKTNKALYEYIVSIDAIEKKTGIDFFPKLNDEIENDLEKNTEYKSWFFN